MIERIKNAGSSMGDLYFPSREFQKLGNDLAGPEAGDCGPQLRNLWTEWGLDNQGAGEKEEEIIHWRRALLGFAWMISDQGALEAPIKPPAASLLHLFKGATSAPLQLRFFKLSSVAFWLGMRSTGERNSKKDFSRVTSAFLSNWKAGSAKGDPADAGNAMCRYMEILQGTVPVAWAENSIDMQMGRNFPAYQFLLDRLKGRDEALTMEKGCWTLKADPASRDIPARGWGLRFRHRLMRWCTGYAFTRQQSLSLGNRMWVVSFFAFAGVLGLAVLASLLRWQEAW